MMTPVIGQTKLIAFKSHSGKMSNFEKALKHPEFDLMFHNLGMAPEPTITGAELDSIIFVSDTMAVMVTSNVCRNSPWYYGNDTTIDFKTKTVWSEGRDTVINHPLFSQQHALDSIKEELKEQYYFRNEIEETVFVGFDNGNKKKDEKEESAPLMDNIPPGENGPGMMIFFMSLFALFIGLIAWRLSLIKKEAAIKTA